MLLSVDACLALELEMQCSEVEQKTNFDACGGEIVYQLRLVRRYESAHGFVLDEYTIGDDHIGHEIAYDRLTVANLKSPLAFDRNTCAAELPGEGVLVH